MAEVLRSYVLGAWHTPSDEGRPLYDAVTGSRGRPGIVGGHRLRGAMLDYARARRRPGAARADLPPAGRAAQGAGRAPAPRAPRGALRRSPPAPAPPAGLDVRHRRRHRRAVQPTPARAAASCPTPPCSSTAPVEPLGKDGTFVGQHIYTPRHGRRGADQRVQLPGLGDAGEARPGLPGRRADAGQARLARRPTWPSRLVELIVASGLLPEGSLQLVAAARGGLLDLLTEQDTVAFTGSASTAATCAPHPSVLHERRAVQLRGRLAELLRPRPRRPRRATAEFDLYVRQLVTEMTVKAGQKCTAIRRALVPATHRRRRHRGVPARIATRSGSATPPRTASRMGALVGLAQRDEVRKDLEALAGAADGSCSATPTIST